MDEKQDHPKSIVDELDFLNDVIPYRCPKCGDNRKFTKLGDLKLHLETDHSYKVGYVKPRARMKVFSHSAKGGNVIKNEPHLKTHGGGIKSSTGSEKDFDSGSEGKLSAGRSRKNGTRSEREISPLLQSYKQDAKLLEMKIKLAKEAEMKRKLERNILDNKKQCEVTDSLNTMNTEVLQSRQKEWQMADELYQSHDVLLNMEQAAEKRCREQQEVIQDIVNEFKFKENQLSQANMDLDKLKSEREKLMLQTEELLTNADKGQESLRKELNKREDMLDSVSEELQSVKMRTTQELQKKEEELVDAKSRLDMLESERNQLIKETEELSDKAGQHSSLLKRTLEVKERQLRKVNKEMEKLKTEQKDLVEESVQLYQTANEGNAKLKELIRSKDNQLSATYQELNEMREVHNKLVWEANQLTKQADENNEKLKALFRSKEEQLQDAQVELERVKMEQKLLLESAKGLQNKVDCADEKVDKLQSVVEQKEEQLAQKERELESIQSFLSSTAEKESVARDKLETFISELIDRADNAEKELRVLKSQTNSDTSESPKYKQKLVSNIVSNLTDLSSGSSVRMTDPATSLIDQNSSKRLQNTNMPQEEVQALVHAGIDLHNVPHFVDSIQEQNMTEDMNHHIPETERQNYQLPQINGAVKNENRINHTNVTSKPINANPQEKRISGKSRETRNKETLPKSVKSELQLQNLHITPIQPPPGFSDHDDHYSVTESDDDIQQRYDSMSQNYMPTLHSQSSGRVKSAHNNNMAPESEFYYSEIEELTGNMVPSNSRVVSPLSAGNAIRTMGYSPIHAGTIQNKQENSSSVSDINKDSEYVTRNLHMDTSESESLTTVNRILPNNNLTDIQHYSPNNKYEKHSQDISVLSGKPNTYFSYDDHSIPHVTKKVTPRPRGIILPRNQSGYSNQQNNYMVDHPDRDKSDMHTEPNTANARMNILQYPQQTFQVPMTSEHENQNFGNSIFREHPTSINNLQRSGYVNRFQDGGGYNSPQSSWQQDDVNLLNSGIHQSFSQNSELKSPNSTFSSSLPIYSTSKNVSAEKLYQMRPSTPSYINKPHKQILSNQISNMENSTNQKPVQKNGGEIVYVPYSMETGKLLSNEFPMTFQKNTDSRPQDIPVLPHNDITALLDGESYNGYYSDGFDNEEYQPKHISDEQRYDMSKHSSDMDEDVDNDNSLDDVLSLTEYERLFSESDDNENADSEFQNFLDENGILWDTTEKQIDLKQQIVQINPQLFTGHPSSSQSSLSNSISDRDKKNLHVRFRNENQNIGTTDVGVSQAEFNTKSPSSVSSESLGLISRDSYIPFQTNDGMTQTLSERENLSHELKIKSDNNMRLNTKSPSSENLSSYSSDSYVPFQKKDGGTQTVPETRTLSESYKITSDFDMSNKKSQFISSLESPVQRLDSRTYRRGVLLSGRISPKLENSPKTRNSSTQTWLLDRHITSANIDLIHERSPLVQSDSILCENYKNSRLVFDSVSVETPENTRYKNLSSSLKRGMPDPKSDQIIRQISPHFESSVNRDLSEPLMNALHTDMFNQSEKKDPNTHDGVLSGFASKMISTPEGDTKQSFTPARNSEHPISDNKSTHFKKDNDTEMLLSSESFSFNNSSTEVRDNIDSKNVDYKRDNSGNTREPTLYEQEVMSKETSICKEKLQAVETSPDTKFMDNKSKSESSPVEVKTLSSNSFSEMDPSSDKEQRRHEADVAVNMENDGKLKSHHAGLQNKSFIIHDDNTDTESVSTTKRLSETAVLDDKILHNTAMPGEQKLSETAKLDEQKLSETAKLDEQKLSQPARLDEQELSPTAKFDEQKLSETARLDEQYLSQTAKHDEQKMSKDTVQLDQTTSQSSMPKDLSQSNSSVPGDKEPSQSEILEDHIKSKNSVPGDETLSQDQKKDQKQSQKSWLVHQNQPQNTTLADLTDTDDDFCNSVSSLDDFRDRMSVASSQDSVLDRVLLKKREDIHNRRNALFRIFSFLDTKSLIDVSLVCREWKKVSRQPTLWKIVSLKYRKISASFLLTISARCTQTESLTLEGLQPRDKYDGESDEGYKNKISGCLEPGLERLLQVSESTLKSVKIVNCGLLLTDKSIWLVSCYSRVIRSICYISDTYSLGADVMWAVGSGCRDIQTLIIPPKYPILSPEKFDNKCLQIISQCCHDLVCLSIGGALIDINGLVLIAKSCQRLHELELHYANDLTEDTATAMCRLGLNALQCLRFIHTPINDKALLQCYKSCKHLKQIEITLSPSDYVDDLNTKDDKIFEKSAEKLKKLLNKPGLGNILKLHLADSC